MQRLVRSAFYVKNDEFCIKMMNCVLKMRNCVSKMMNCGHSSSDMLQISSVLLGSAGRDEINSENRSTLDEHYLELAEAARDEIDEANQFGADGAFAC